MNVKRQPIFQLTLQPTPDSDGVRGLRQLLKIAKRRFGLHCVSCVEGTAPINTANQVATAFTKLRDDVARRAARIRRQTRATGDMSHE